MRKLSRRKLIATGCLAGAGVFAGLVQPVARAARGKLAGALAGRLAAFEFEPVALPFDPGALAGLSGPMLSTHHEKHYMGALKRLNEVRALLGGLAEPAEPYLFGALKREEMRLLNAMVLHELYFGNLGGQGKPGGAIKKAIESAYGTCARWRRDFMATALSLAPGPGWVCLTFLPRDRQLVNSWSPDGMVAMAQGVPLVVLDMYEHAYRADYGLDAHAYIGAFLANLDWAAADRRFASCL